MASFWDKNPEITKQVYKLWEDGMPAAHIIMELGLVNVVSRNAIIGRVNRERQKLGRAAGAQGKNRQSLFLSVKTPPPVFFSPKTPPPQTHAHREHILEAPDGVTTKVHLIDAKRHHCRWVLGEPVNGWFCGATVAPDVRLPYCPYHQSLIYQPGTSYHRKTYARNYRR